MDDFMVTTLWFDDVTVAAATARVAQNIASGVGGEVSARRRRGGDDHLAVVVWLVCGSDSEVRSGDDIRPSPLRRGPHGALARWR